MFWIFILCVWLGYTLLFLAVFIWTEFVQKGDANEMVEEETTNENTEVKRGAFWERHEYADKEWDDVKMDVHG